MKYGILTKPIHVEKIVNYLNQHTDLHYVITTNKEEIYAYDFDIGVSYSYARIIDIDDEVNKKRVWYNYHPAPLPDYPGLMNYACPIRDKVTEFGVSLHIMTMVADKGPLLKVRRFSLDDAPINSNELGNITHYHLFQLFKETIKVLQYKPKTKNELEIYAETNTPV